MSAHRYHVISEHANGTMAVWPADGKSLSKKDAQRLGHEVVNELEFGTDMKVKQAKVVEVSMIVNPS